ncbi:MAG: hypothetical protein JWO80_6216 [Bryobacterales bacterium]|nr:hypothetical protein [Bryobacterales bacterium]
MASALLQLPPSTAVHVLAAIEQFLASARQPALLEPGEQILPLVKDSWSCELRSSHVLLQAWDERRNLSRRIVAAREQTRGKLVLTVQLFGGKEGKLDLLDLAAPRTAEWKRRGVKLVFRERFRQMLSREFPEWRIAELTAEADLEHSLSPAYPRALLRHGNRAIAAIGAGPEALDVAGALTFGLIWLDYLRGRERKVAVDRLVVVAPAGRERPIAQRALFLIAPIEMLTYTENDFAARVDLADAGNIDSALEPCRLAPGEAFDAGELDSVPGFEQVGRPDGTCSLRVHGLEFAAVPGSKRPAELLVHARELSRLRSEKGSLLHEKDPERWLESEVRRNLQTVDAALRTAPVYGQVPAFSAGARGIVDLLAIDHAGQLAVLELKASGDIHLPLQALDYWMRVSKHAEHCDFMGNGYFPGLSVSPQKPKLLLVAPSLEFHPSTETILGYFSPEIEVQRIGLAADWRRYLRVMFRLTGAERP